MRRVDHPDPCNPKRSSYHSSASEGIATLLPRDLKPPEQRGLEASPWAELLLRSLACLVDHIVVQLPPRSVRLLLILPPLL